jgi:LysM repeat protein
MKKTGLIVVLVLMLLLTTAGIASAQVGTVHRVSYGDTLYSIAARYGVSVDSVMRQNGLMNPNLIYIGQPLSIPGGQYYAGAPGRPAPGGCGSYHVVVPGETLSGIAYQYGVPVRDVVGMNNFYNRDVVYPGQQVCMPGGYGPQPQPAAHYGSPGNAYYHTVTYGETIYYIADRYGVNYYELMQANHLDGGGFIIEGQQLYIPGYYPAAPAPVPAPVQPAYGPPVVEEIIVEEVVVGGPAPAYHPAPAHHPVVSVPPIAPGYGGAVPVGETPGITPVTPNYQEVPEKPLLPEAPHPIEVVVNGGAIWAGEVYPKAPDPAGRTVLVVSTRETDEPTVWLRSGDYEVKGELGLVPEFGVDQFRFVFRHIPPGDYDVWFDDPEGTLSEKVPVKVEAGHRVEVNFKKGVGFTGPTYASPDGWVLGNWANPSKPGENIGAWSNILVRTPASGLNVKIQSEGKGYEATCFTGEKAPGVCDFAGLSAGLYYVWIDGTQLTLKTYMDGAAFAEFEFVRQPTSGDPDAVGPVSYSD